ncbi:MAG: alpha/beta hydrolase [Vicinamibacterales bacterium]|nr:alpha/beta hydrolase [Vicinamibacterales bacterium]
MAIRYWMITNRNQTKPGKADNELGSDESNLTFWTSDADGGAAPVKLAQWKKWERAAFTRELSKAALKFPRLPEEKHEDEKHVTLFIHGFNNSSKDALGRYSQICQTMFDGPNGMGLCVLFSWPSDGLKVGYYPDRADARATADELGTVLCDLFDFQIASQEEAMRTGRLTCRAKVSVIAHSMGNYLIQKAMQFAWSRKNQPLLLSLVNQLLMVAADVDNDLFKGGEGIDRADGDAIANLCYRVTALYSGKDATLGLSAGIKHFGKRRLGRSGLDRLVEPPDNVWDIDCTRFFDAVDPSKAHSAYFDVQDTRRLMREILRGTDRTLVESTFR